MNKLCKQIELLKRIRRNQKILGLDTTQIDKDLKWFYSRVDSMIRRSARKINI